jgi:hypothetical protein
MQTHGSILPIGSLRASEWVSRSGENRTISFTLFSVMSLLNVLEGFETIWVVVRNGLLGLNL